MLTTDQILALSPDDSSAKAAKGLLAPAKWLTLGHDEVAIWGECQGSGSKPYQVIIEVSGPSFKCSCPSRKFPCKHGLALYLLLAQKPSAFTANTQPTWVNEWLSARQDRAEKKAEKATQTEAKPADTEATAKREAKRLERMINGALDLERWMADLVRHGIADLPAKPVTFWRDAAARLVDAQASGLAAGVRQLESAVSSGQGWQQRTLLNMGRLQLLTEAMQRMDALPERLRHDVRSSAGWAMDKEEVLAANDRVSDAWHVLGISHDENEKLWERRVWLRGAASGRNALLLDFSHGGRRFDQVFVPGTVVKATLCFFPSASPLRALWVDEPPSAQSSAEEAESNKTPLRTSALSATSAVNATWDAALSPVSDALVGQPWFQRLPLTLSHGVPVFRDLRWYLRDMEGREAQMRVSTDDGWQLAALSGGLVLRRAGQMPESGGWAICQIRSGFCEIALRASMRKGFIGEVRAGVLAQVNATDRANGAQEPSPGPRSLGDCRPGSAEPCAVWPAGRALKERRNGCGRSPALLQSAMTLSWMAPRFPRAFALGWNPAALQADAHTSTRRHPTCEGHWLLWLSDTRQRPGVRWQRGKSKALASATPLSPEVGMLV